GRGDRTARGARARWPVGCGHGARPAAVRARRHRRDRAESGAAQRADGGQQVISGAKLRFARQARGFSQQQLAGMAGVSRQAVSAVESGQSDPSLRVALALAQALGVTVEELFGAEGTIAAVSAQLVGSPAEAESAAGARVTLASVGDSFVALPLAGPTVRRAGFLPAGGLLTGEAAGSPDGSQRPDERARSSVRPGGDATARAGVRPFGDATAGSGVRPGGDATAGSGVRPGGDATAG